MGKVKRKLYKFLPLIKPLAAIASLFIFLAFIYLVSPIISNISKQLLRGPKIAFSLLMADTTNLQADNNRTNLLLLGIKGTKQEGDDLTDTLIFMSINRTSADTVMLSLPRDIWLDSLQAKINSSYHYGELKQAGGGFVLTKDAVYEVLNQPIHYQILIDFNGFIKIVDLLGGLDINVERIFDDYKYPIAGKENDLCEGDQEYKCRYDHLHFEKGLQHMDGQTALKYVRSRNAEGEEGTDFSRSQRQQKFILALKDKVFNLQFLLNPQKIMEVKTVLSDNIKFDSQFNEEQITSFLSLLIRFVKNNNKIRTISLETGTEDNPGFLYNPPIAQYGQWVLIPNNNDWSEIHRYVKDKIDKLY